MKDNNAHFFELINNIPLSVVLWNTKYERILCNHFSLELFGFDNENDFPDSILPLSPTLQPDGRTSIAAHNAYIKELESTEKLKFYWMHKSTSGEELPCEITLFYLNATNEHEDPILVSCIRDLRSQLAEYDTDSIMNTFFLDRITDKALFNAVAELSDEWFWAYDVKSSTIQFYGKGRNILNQPSEKQIFPQGVIASGVIYPDDIRTYLEFASAVKKGFDKPYDVRFILPDGSARYFRIVFKTTYDANGNAIFSIGKTFDIHDQKRLEVLSRTDLLTNCLNKITTENSIKETIDSSSNHMHALFIVDIDNFKAVNDNLGHHFGDIVLREISNNLHANFRGDDIIGRIGGDEFIVFVKNITNMNIIREKAKAISKAFQNKYSGKKDNYKVSGSIGISIYPKDGKNYEELYQAADKALYHSKMLGKDCYTMYSDKLSDGTMKNLTILENANRLANSYFDSDLVSTVFDLMYDSKKPAVALNLILQLIGNCVNVDRCYIFEAYNSGSQYAMTYEWCSRDVSAAMHNFQEVPKDSFDAMLHDLNANNDIVYCNDVDLIENHESYRLMRGYGVKAFLMLHVKGKEYVEQVLVLEDCKSSRVWSEKEINTVRYALKMISIFMTSHCKNLSVPNIKQLGIELNDEELALLEKLKENGISFSLTL